MQPQTLSFRAGDDFVKSTTESASLVGLSRSDYVREAVREKNERTMAAHIAALSRELADDHRAFNETLDGATADGLD